MPTVDDPRFAALEAALASRPPLRAPRGTAGSAAVALLLRPAAPHPELLLIRRAEREGDPWSGHMALPGGRASPADAGPEATAARESWEEVGIDPLRDGRLLGALDEVAPRSARGATGLVVSPFVFAVGADARAVPNYEVQAALWIGVGELLHPDAVTEYLYELADGNRLPFPAFDARGYVVWGMTHRILTGFLELYAQAVEGDGSA